MRLPAVLSALIAATLLAGCGADDATLETSAAAPPAEAAAAPAPSPDGATAEIGIADFAYDPATVTVKAGTAVSWTNEDAAAHTATISTGTQKFDTATIEEGQTATVTFDTPGTYAYICVFHPLMKGTLVVEK